jgi:hypothetical protein
MISEYKKSTKSFLDWIIHKSNICKPELKNNKVTVRNLRIRVNEIILWGHQRVQLDWATEFSRDLTKIMSKAIELRKQVHSIHQNNEKTKHDDQEELSRYTLVNKSHLFFIKFLEDSQRKLGKWALSLISLHLSKSDQPLNEVHVFSKFAGLELTEDLPDDRAHFLDLDSMETILDMDVKDLDQEYGDLCLQLICYLIELTTLDNEIQTV